MTGSDSAGALSQKRKAVQTATVVSTIASSRGSKYSLVYTQTLYQLGILDSNKKGIIPSVPSQTEVCKYFSEPTEIPVLSGFMQSWFQEFEPDEETLVHLLSERLFLQKISIPGEPHVTILYEFSGPFEYHDLQELKRGDEGVKYPFIKHVQDEEEFEYLQTPANEDLRARSDFVFAASINWFERLVQSKIKLIGNSFSVPCVSNTLRSCAVAIAVEVKATASKASFLAAKNQWKALAYMQLKERVSISREKSYVGDENICQYGYVICGLEIIIWKMSLQWNRSKHRDSEILEQDFTFPVETVDMFALRSSIHLEKFIAAHKRLLQWWLNGYLPSYIADLTNIITAHPDTPAEWITPWQQAADRCSDGEGDREVDGEGNGLEEGHEEAQESEDGEHEPSQEENDEEHGKPDSEEQEEDVEDDIGVDGDGESPSSMPGAEKRRRWASTAFCIKKGDKDLNEPNNNLRAAVNLEIRSSQAPDLGRGRLCGVAQSCFEVFPSQTPRM